MNQRNGILALCAVLALGVGLANPLASFGLAGTGAIALAILTVAAVLWVTEAIPLYATSFLVLLLCLTWLHPALVDAGASVERGVFLAPFFSDLVLLFLGGFVLAAAWSRYELDNALASAILRRSGRDVPSVMAALMAITALLSMWLSNTAATALMLGIALPLVDALPADGTARRGLLLSVPMAANVGGLGTPIGTPPNAIALQFLADIGHPISFVGWMGIGVPAVVLFIGLIWTGLLAMYGGRELELPPPQPPSPVPESARGSVRLVIGLSLVTVLGWLFGDQLGLTAGTVALVPVTGLFGLGVLRLADFRGLAWDVLFLMGGGLCLAQAMSQSGLADWIVAGLPTEGASTWAIAAGCLVLAAGMSTVMSNTATANLLAPVVAGMADVERAPVLVALAFGCSLAMALPISTPPNAMAFATGQLSARDLLRTGLVMTLGGAVLVVGLGFGWWRLLGVV